MENDDRSEEEAHWAPYRPSSWEGSSPCWSWPRPPGVHHPSASSRRS